MLSSGSMADYLQNIQHVQILAEGAEKPTEQEIVGHHSTVGSFIALDENGVLNADGIVKARDGSENPLFEAGKQYTVTVAAFGYPELVFPYTKLGVWPDIAGENGTSYVSLFDTIVTEEWNPLWTDYIGAVMGEDAAPAMAAALQGSVTSNLHGEEAIAAFANGGYAFDCHFINGAQSLTFKDDTVTILKTDGTQETHTYEYQGKVNIGESETMMYQGAEISMAFPVDVYRSTDEAGEFNYFMMREDTMDTTWHLEFRYGSDLEALQGYMVGPYAYWLAAGIDANADADTIRNVIALFCLENMDYSTHTDAALSQISDLGMVGSWKADLSAYGEDYATDGCSVAASKLPAIHPKASVGILHCFIFVGHNQHGSALVVCIIIKHRQNLACVFIVQIAGRLIGKQIIRLLRQGTRNGHAPELAAGKLCRSGIPEARNFQPLHPLLCFLYGQRSSAELCGKQNIFKHRQGIDRAAALRNNADSFAAQPGKRLIVQAVQADVFQPHLSLRRRQQPAKHVQQRGLAGAAPSHQHGGLPAVQLQIQGVDGKEIIGIAGFAKIPFGNVFCFHEHISFPPAGRCPDPHGLSDMPR